MKKELKKEFKTNQAIEKLKNLNCEVIDIYEKGYVVYISFKNIDNTKETRTVYDILEDITDVYYCELVASEVKDDVLEILTDDLKNDLEKVLDKIKKYGELANK